MHLNCKFSFPFFNIKIQSTLPENDILYELLMNNVLVPLRRLKAAISKWPIPHANFYLNSGQFLRTVADSPNLYCT